MSMDTTFQELLDMRQKLNEALEAKIGRKPASGFNIEMGSHHDDQISFCLAYVEIELGSVVKSYETKETPQAAFDFAMSRIEALVVKTPEQKKADKIAALKQEIEALEAEK